MYIKYHSFIILYINNLQDFSFCHIA
jgi:hypothetical protein